MPTRGLFGALFSKLADSLIKIGVPLVNLFFGCNRWHYSKKNTRIRCCHWKVTENSGVLIAGSTEAVKHEIKKDKVYFGMLLGTLGASMLGNMLTGKGVMRVRKEVMRAGKGCNPMDHMGQHIYFRFIL